MYLREIHQGAGFFISKYFQILGKLKDSERGVRYQVLKELTFNTAKKERGGGVLEKASSTSISVLQM